MRKERPSRVGMRLVGFIRVTVVKSRVVKKSRKEALWGNHF